MESENELSFYAQVLFRIVIANNKEFNRIPDLSMNANPKMSVHCMNKIYHELGRKLYGYHDQLISRVKEKIPVEYRDVFQDGHDAEK